MGYDGKVTISTALDNTGVSKDTQKLGSIVKNGTAGLAKAVAKSALAITAAFGTAAVAITKQAVDSYADYQQLMGGVETLFKDSASKVAQYAEDAFYTVGMSANEYMETVTGFSASLISALAGDTEKAADVANMALTDMADNANKMGTPLESIKIAYQGFAKQNYTMLDNLKLGYGGTKTEMERLLRDAEKLSGVKYNISNLADVYNAIHRIQEEMGIAGATAAEAEKTISGSAAMTKAAWKNVLTAIAGGGDIDKAINNLVFSVSKYFENIVPVVERALSGIGELIEKVAPMLVQTVATALIKAIPQLLNAVYQMIIGLAAGIYEGIVALISGATKEIDKQTDTTDGVANGFAAATEGAEAFAEANEKAKKSLAGFDEIQKIGGVEASDSTGTVGSGVGSGMGALDEAVENLVTPEAESAIGAVIDGILEKLRPLGDWIMNDAGPASVGTLRAEFRALGAVLSPVWEGLQKLLEHLKPVAGFIGDVFVATLSEWEGFFTSLADKFEEKGSKIEEIFSGIGEIITAVWTVMEPILTALMSKIQEIVGIVKDFAVNQLGFLIDGLHGIVEFVAGVLTGDWQRAWDGLVAAVKAPINNVINFLNSMIRAVVAGVNSVIDLINKLSFDVPDWVPGIGGETFGFNLSHVTAPQIPYLARGAVLPANKPFLAMVGDQKHGTNVEAPLETIQEAVALVMEDMVASNIAGFEAVVAVLREILEAVLGIEIGDDVIGRAVARYNRKMAIVRGGL